MPVHDAPGDLPLSGVVHHPSDTTFPRPAGNQRSWSPYRSPVLGALLSFVVPGLGQLVAGRWRRGLAIAAPVLAVVAFVAGIALVDRNVIVRAVLFRPEGSTILPVLLGLIGLSLALLVYRLWAIVDAYLGNRRLAPAGPAPAGERAGIAAAGSAVALVAILAVTIGMHGWVAWVGWNGHEAITSIFDPAGPNGGNVGALPSIEPTATPEPSPTPSDGPTASPTAVPTPTLTPEPTPQPVWAADGRLNVLLIGSDAGPGRWSMRADALILVSVDIESGRVAAFSLPRYTKNVPLPEPAASAFACRCLSEDYINALYVYANQHPDLFPGENEIDRGLTALTGAFEALFDTTIDGMAVADLNGFVQLIDAMGGITIDVPYEIYDAQYPPPDGSPLVELYFAPGVQQMDGWHALAFARTRHQDGDVARMQRQQIVIQALGRELRCDLLGNLPAVLDVAADALWTNLPLESVPDMLSIDPGPVESHVLFDTHNVQLTEADIARLRADLAGAFDGPPPTDGPGGGGGC
ncbi:MAG TPA: LCP family protein [Candidatus Limnocylindria bacterium]|nr:LCP family protein [Candidatus Limnocylindria bacterium]